MMSASQFSTHVTHPGVVGAEWECVWRTRELDRHTCASRSRASDNATRGEEAGVGGTARWTTDRPRPRHSSIAIDIDIVEVNRCTMPPPKPPKSLQHKQTSNHVVGVAPRKGLSAFWEKGPRSRAADMIRDRDAIMSFISLGSCTTQKWLSGFKPCLCPEGRFPSRWSRPS